MTLKYVFDRLMALIGLNLYYLHHYSFLMDIRMIFATILGRRIRYANQSI